MHRPLALFNWWAAVYMFRFRHGSALFCILVRMCVEAWKKVGMYAHFKYAVSVYSVDSMLVCASDELVLK